MLASMQIRLRFVPSAFSALVTKTRCLTRIALPLPGAGNFAFHKMFSSGLHRVGTDFASANPFPCGPRNCDQSSANNTELSRNNQVRPNASVRVNMFISHDVEIAIKTNIFPSFFISSAAKSNVASCRSTFFLRTTNTALVSWMTWNRSKRHIWPH